MYCQNSLIFRLLKLHNICWGSPGEHLAVGPRKYCRKIMEKHTLEVDQSSSTIFGRMVAGNVHFFYFLMISCLYLSSLMQAKHISCGMIGLIFYVFLK